MIIWISVTLYRPTYRLSPEGIGLLEKIARLEGEIRASARDLKSDATIQAEAAIDSVHYSTRIEGNALTREQVTRALTGKRPSVGRRERDLKEVLNYSKTRHMLFERAAKGHGLTTVPRWEGLYPPAGGVPLDPVSIPFSVLPVQDTSPIPY